jgi:hypothetical protein
VVRITAIPSSQRRKEKQSRPELWHPPWFQRKQPLTLCFLS